MHDLVQPSAWVAIKLSSEALKVVQVTPNTTISLGKYGAFPTNLIIERPYHLTYEVQDKRNGENFSRLRVVPASEIHADVLAEISGQKTPSPDEDIDPDSAAETNAEIESGGPTNLVAIQDGGDYALVDKDSGDVLARSGRNEVEAQARQLLTTEEIEELKKKDADGGKNIIAKLMLSHTALGEKTSFSLAKYKIMKNKKYLRWFQVLPLHPSTLGQHVLEEKDASKVMEMRQETLALLACWGNVHFTGNGSDPETRLITEDSSVAMDTTQIAKDGRWLVVDDTGGLVVASLAERMGLLYPQTKDESTESRPAHESRLPPSTGSADGVGVDATNGSGVESTSIEAATPASGSKPNGAKAIDKSHRTHRDDFEVNLATKNTITLLHTAGQPNLAHLKYWNCDEAAPNPDSGHPLATHLLTVSWLQLLEPQSDNTYANRPRDATSEELQSWKSNRRGNYHRKRRRWARTKFMVDQARAGGFSGLVVASTMDVVSIMRSALPLLAGGAPISVYSPTVEPLTELADCFSVARRGAWASSLPAEAEDMSQEELEKWEGTDDYPVNPTLLIGATVQTTRAKRWQVLPGRTHPLMMGRGGAEGYVFTGWKAVPAEGKVEARGKFKRRKVD